jgi:DNA-binding GntR family transcriptional regulator
VSDEPSASEPKADPEPVNGEIRNAEDLADILRLRIQKSELAPGEWLREVRLCAEFGVGRSIVRRALRTLGDDGLIELEENRGARVSATSVEEVFDLYEVRAALYGMAARFACMRGSPALIRTMLVKIDQMLAAAGNGAPAEEIMELSESIFSDMTTTVSPDGQRMIAAIRRKTRWHFSYLALALNIDGPGPYQYWHRIRDAFRSRDGDAASLAARELIYFMQSEVARIMLARGPRLESAVAGARGRRS